MKKQSKKARFERYLRKLDNMSNHEIVNDMIFVEDNNKSLTEHLIKHFNESQKYLTTIGILNRKVRLLETSFEEIKKIIDTKSDKITDKGGYHEQWNTNTG